MHKGLIGFAAAVMLAWGSQSVLAGPWMTLNGQPINPQQNPHKKAAVLFFMSVDCPNSNGYSPAFNAMVKQYGANVAFYVVHEDDGSSPKEMQKHDKDYRYTCPVVVDPNHSLARHYRIEVTPEVAVLDPSGKELYRGRIDDRYTSCGSAANQTSHDLVDALTAVLSGHAVAHAYVPGAGCSIYYKP